MTQWPPNFAHALAWEHKFSARLRFQLKLQVLGDFFFHAPGPGGAAHGGKTYLRCDLTRSNHGGMRE